MEELSKLTPEELASAVKGLYETNGPLCDSEGFYNHVGECWSDTLQMIFLNSDFIKEKVQAKLAKDEIDPAEVEQIFRPYIEESIELLLQSKKQNMNEYNKNQLVLAYIGNVYAFLLTVQKRFHRHYYAEALRLSLKDELCTLEDMKGLQALTKLKAISLLHKTKGKEGVLSAYLGQNIQKYKLENIRSSKILQNTYKPGGGQEDRDNVYIIFQQFFDLPISQTYYTYKFTNIEGTIQSVGGFFDGKKNTFTVEDSCLGFYAAYFSIDERQTGHAVAFYTCGGRDFYFNDNVGTIQFPWRKFLYHFTDKKTEAMLTGESLFVNEPIHESNKLVQWKTWFDGKLILKDKSGYELFSTKTYPYLMRTMYEKVTNSDKPPPFVLYEIITYLWDGTPIKLESRKTKLADIVFEKIAVTESGEEITLTFEVGEPKHALKYLTSYDLIAAPNNAEQAHRKNRETGTFLGARINYNNSKMSDAILEGFLQKVEKGKANINDVFYTDPDGDKFTPLTFAIETGKDEYIDKILRMGADVNKRAPGGSSPLFLAASYGTTIKVLESLLGKGELINDRDNLLGGYTPLIGAIQMNEELNLDAIQFLLDHGADYTIPSKRTDTLPIEYAQINLKEDVVKLLEQYGAKPFTCPKKEDLNKIVDREMFDTQLMSYIRNHKLIKARLLTKCYRELESYDDLNFENKLGDTALKLAIRFEPDENLIEELIRNGADVNHVDKMGFTPIHYAIKLGSSSVVEELIKQDINYQLSAPGAGTPLEYAELLGKKDIVELMKPEIKKFTWRLERKKKAFVPIPTVPVKKTPMSFSPRPVKKLTLSKALDNTRRGGRRLYRKKKTHKRKH